MSRKWFSIIALIATATFLMNVASCGFNQHLVSISITPSTFTFGTANPNLLVGFGALGTYIHPPATKDVTSLVTWASDNPQVVQISSTGVASPSPTLNCGIANIGASFYDSPNLVTSNIATVTVDGPAALGCTPAGPQPILTVSFAGLGTGTVTGSVSCSSPGSCSEQFTIGSTLTLTASPTNNSSFSGWSGCTSTSGPEATVCIVNLQNNLTVTATFGQ
jgi:List-Bact-rpt repeat protein